MHLHHMSYGCGQVGHLIAEANKDKLSVHISMLRNAQPEAGGAGGAQLGGVGGGQTGASKLYEVILAYSRTDCTRMVDL